MLRADSAHHSLALLLVLASCRGSACLLPPAILTRSRVSLVDTNMAVCMVEPCLDAQASRGRAREALMIWRDLGACLCFMLFLCVLLHAVCMKKAHFWEIGRGELEQVGHDGIAETVEFLARGVQGLRTSGAGGAVDARDKVEEWWELVQEFSPWVIAAQPSAALAIFLGGNADVEERAAAFLRAQNLGLYVGYLEARWWGRGSGASMLGTRLVLVYLSLVAVATIGRQGGDEEREGGGKKMKEGDDDEFGDFVEPTQTDAEEGGWREFAELLPLFLDSSDQASDESVAEVAEERMGAEGDGLREDLLRLDGVRDKMRRILAGEQAQGGAGESGVSGRGMVEAQTLLDFVESLPPEVNLWEERVLLHRCLAFDDVKGGADANAGGQAWVQHGKALEILVRLGAQGGVCVASTHSVSAC